MPRKLAIALAVLAVVAAGGLFLLSRPAVVNFIGGRGLGGVRFHVADLDVSTGGVRAEGLELSSGGVQAKVAAARISADPLSLRIEEVTLEGARFTYVYDPEAAGAGYQDSLAALPAVGRLVVKDAAAEVRSKDGAWSVEASGLSATVEDFSPRRGGRLTLASRVRLSSADGASEAAGKVSAKGSLSALLPRPVGRVALSADLAGRLAGRSCAALRLSLPVEATDAGLVRLAGGTLSASGVETTPGAAIEAASVRVDATADLKRRRFEIVKARAQVAGMGELGVEASGGWEEAGPLALHWQARLAADSLQVDRVREVMSPLAPALAQWQAGGTATLAGEVAGRWAGALTYEGEVRLQLAQGSFSSPDYTKAGEDIAATVRVHLRSEGPPKAGFEAAAEVSRGQLLAGGVFLPDLSALRPRVEADGSFFLTRPGAG